MLVVRRAFGSQKFGHLLPGNVCFLAGWHLCRTHLARRVFNSKRRVKRTAKRKVKRKVRKTPRNVPEKCKALFSCLQVVHRHFSQLCTRNLQIQLQTQFQLFFSQRESAGMATRRTLRKPTSGTTSMNFVPANLPGTPPFCSLEPHE